MKPKQLTIDIILILIVLAGITSFFYNPLQADMRALQILVGGILGWITKGVFGGEIPVARAFK